MRLSPANFNRFLDGGDVSRPIAWQKSYACPCVNPNSGAAKIGCPICNSKGRIWDAEITGSAGLSAMNQKRGFANFGTWQPGDALLTIPSSAPFYDAAQFDKFRALDSWHEFSEVIQPGGGLTGTVAVDANGDPLVSRAFWLSTDGTTIIDGAIPTVAGTALSWPDGGGPPGATQFSVTYQRYDEFFVYLTLASTRNAGISGLPRKLPLRVFDLYGR